MTPQSFHIERRGEGRSRRWRAVMYVGKRDGGPRRDCGTWRESRHEAKADGQTLLDNAVPATGDGPTVSALLTRYIAALPRLRPTTAQRYEHDRKRVAADKGELLAAAVLPVEWDEYFASLAPSLAPKSVANLRGLVHAAYRWAVKGRLLVYNPVADTDPPKVDRTKPRAPTVGRVQEGLAAVHGRRLEGAAVLMAACGLRAGEAVARRWSDLAKGEVRVPTQLTQTRDAAKPKGKRLVLHEGEPKSRRGKRTVPVPAPALAMLADLKRRQQAECLIAGRPWSDERLISHRRDGSPVPPNQASSELGELWRKAGFTELHPHLLRHAFITELVVRRGVDAQTAADLAGHSTPATTLTYYTHSDEAAKQAATAALSRAWEDAAVSVSASRRHQLGTGETPILDIATARARKKPA